MRKRIAVVFFDNKNDKIPKNSNVLVKVNPTVDDVESWLEQQTEQMAFWVVQHPEGKTEIVWIIA